jgi:hypothetical protein
MFIEIEAVVIKLLNIDLGYFLAMPFISLDTVLVTSTGYYSYICE